MTITVSSASFESAEEDFLPFDTIETIPQSHYSACMLMQQGLIFLYENR